MNTSSRLLCDCSLGSWMRADMMLRGHCAEQVTAASGLQCTIFMCCDKMCSTFQVDIQHSALCCQNPQCWSRMQHMLCSMHHKSCFSTDLKFLLLAMVHAVCFCRVRWNVLATDESLYFVQEEKATVYVSLSQALARTQYWHDNCISHNHLISARIHKSSNSKMHSK